MQYFGIVYTDSRNTADTKGNGSDRSEVSDMDSYDTISDLLVNLFNEIMDIEEKAIITEEFQDITNNDMHIIAAIGIDLPAI